MFLFSKDQEVYDIAGVKIGGQPGQYPTVLIGSVFYDGHNVVEDDDKGIFDEEKVGKQIKKMEELSESTGNPAMLDVVGGSSESLINYIDFIAEVTELPFLIDGTTADIRIEATEHVKDMGLSDRGIYNAITVDCSEEEIEVIKKAGIKSAVLLCYNAKKPTIDGRMESFEKVSNYASDAGIEKPLVDPSIIDLPDPGPASRTIFKIKEGYGLPCGCGAHNSVDQWRERVEMSPEMYKLRTAVTNSFPITMGADFSLFGPIEDAEEAYAACSLVDAFVGYSMRMEEGLGPESKDHPLYKIFRPS